MNPRISELKDATPDELTAAMEQTLTGMMQADARMMELAPAVQEYEVLKGHFAFLKSLKDGIGKLLDQLPRM